MKNSGSKGHVATDFSVALVDYAAAADALHAVRNEVFVREQQVPVDLERDAADPHCLHVVARDAAGTPIGTGRLVPPDVASHGDTGQARVQADRTEPAPPARIGRMAVLPAWRGRGVGEAMLAALSELAVQEGWQTLALNAQASAIRFYARLGYLPQGERFSEAGIEHQAMRRKLAGPNAIGTREEAVASVVALAHHTRRCLRISSQALDRGLFDDPDALDALRRLAILGHGVEVRILLQDAATPQREHVPLLPLAQRLSSVFQLREIDPLADQATLPAFIANDTDGYYFRSLGHRFDGEADLHAPGRSRQLREEFDRTWERALPCTELRALGI